MKIENFEGFFPERVKNMPKSVIRELLKITQDPEIISFGCGLPDPDTFPVNELADITRQVYMTKGAQALQYGTTEGYKGLRAELSKWMSKEGIEASIDSILPISGSQQGLDFFGKLFIEKGSRIIVEEPSYLGALQAFSFYEPEFIGVPLDENGMKTDVLEEKLEKFDSSIKFMYLVPDFHNPAGVTLSHERRKKIIELAEQYNLIVIEDSPYRELRYNGDAIPSIYALAQANGMNNIISLRTFSKTISPGLRIGWITGDEAVIDTLVKLKQGADLCSPVINQIVAAEFLKNWNLEEHIEKIKEKYSEKRDLMLEVLDAYMPKHPEVEWTKPDGGLFLWLSMPKNVDTSEMCKRAVKEEKVGFIPGYAFYHDGSVKNKMRLNFSYSTPGQIEVGIKRLGSIAEREIDGRK
ncbi:MAG: PLP-dependent aminotransferase family protein [Candidatus Woesearchaeota archaeon]|nr:PLP-dependent aminotransferase family protein [Candidatus Woesearchaeota archaeon]